MESLKILLLLALVAQCASADVITVTNADDSGPGTLRQALSSAADGDRIDFLLPTPVTITLTSGELLVTKNVTILGPGATNLAVDGNASGRVLHIASNTVASVSGLTITNGLGLFLFPFLPGGGGVWNDHATLTVSNCALRGNSARLGGGIFNDSGSGYASLRIVNSTLSDNVGSVGGAINSGGLGGGSASVEIRDCVLRGNSATTNGVGGAIYNIGSSGNAKMLVMSTTLEANSALEAGAIYNEDATMSVSNCVLDGNSASLAGGAFNYSATGGLATLTIVTSTLKSNAASFGGGLFNMSGGQANVVIANTTLAGNSATSDGGGIFSEAYASGTATVEIVNSTLSGNWAGGFAGAIVNREFDSGSARLRIANSTLSGNSTTNGSGDISNVALDGNAILELGSTILNSDSPGGSVLNILGTVISDGYNLSSDDGGGFLTNAIDQINTDPMLGPLQDNGGPTFTHALLAGSPAIDKGKNFSGSATDQRGFSRTIDDPAVPNAPGGDGTDIGAFERQETFNARDAIEALIDEVDAAGERVKPLEASLRAALKSLNKGHVGPAINQLQAFQHKVRTQVAKRDPALAQALTQADQDIIDALGSR